MIRTLKQREIFTLVLIACSATTFAQERSMNFESEQAWLEYKLHTSSKQIRSSESWFDYFTDSCDNYPDKGHKFYLHYGMRYCADRSASFVQPPSTGINGYEGKCGHTMAANMFNVICKRAVHPAQYFKSLFSDLTPGVRPGTFVRGMKRAFAANTSVCPDSQGNWQKIHYRSSEQFIKEVKKYLEPNYSDPNQQRIVRNDHSYTRNPVGVLHLSPGSSIGLHWAMVVDHIEKNNQCHFVVNHWDSQFEVPCTTLALWSKHAGEAFPVIMNPYQIVVFK